ncbi:MAG TPA: TetR family transcriptional regulator [Nocardioides sp.]|uniref:TetR family transcriptional regulator n=1 Tax=uncultured Nocardioides sp. TaxID=198441 RepID=UPI00262D61F4|nr:TetR family transcriptional regulator [uncultured Nocardioides sp.]HRD61038.1 TetR family transcriptional regulator [Nocardioides sp.]HRK48711.1 TetR family transcriptional regulator [Nocardioides sp.]
MTDPTTQLTTQPLTRETILDAAEEVLRRYGPAKASVIDVARALDVSHGSVYRHFSSKAALRDAVTERWLERVSNPLEQIVGRRGKASRRLHDWLVLLATTKQSIATDDPELFSTFHQLTLASREVVADHVDHLADQVARILADGIATGEFAQADPSVVGRAVLHATARFHHPALAGEWSDRTRLAAELEAVYSLLQRGLLAGD